MSYRTRRANPDSDEDTEWLRDLHDACFGNNAPQVPYDYGMWWLAYKKDEPDPIGFTGVVPSTLGTGYAYLKRSGVMPIHRGHGLQRRFINIRERWAKREGYHTLVTDTFANTPSANNLIRCGFILFDPVYPWGINGGLYFCKAL